MNREFIGSEFDKCSFKLPSSRILEEGMLISPTSPFIFEVNPISE
jgi:hypothetical protein|tara:strand:+ start:293 stop:427 length:135 start_codon:yes stop_codon:yes gene_type:complete